MSIFELATRELITKGIVAVKDSAVVDIFKPPSPKAAYGCPPQAKLIPWLVGGICRHWHMITSLGEKK
jgi:hypothetical protein